MSKRSEREQRENKQKQRSEFLEILGVYLKMFAECLPRSTELGASTDLSITAFDIALCDLSPSELKLACEESLRRCEWFPRPADIRESLRVARERLNEFGNSPTGKNCQFCGGSKWKVVPNPWAPGYEYAVRCDCPEITELVCPSHWSEDDCLAARELYASSKDKPASEWKKEIADAICAIGKAMEQELKGKAKERRDRKMVEFQVPDTEYVATVDGVPLLEWAKNQNLSDSLPRTAQEIELIKTMKRLDKPKRTRAPL